MSNGTPAPAATQEPAPTPASAPVWPILDLRTGTEVDAATFSAYATYMQSKKYHTPK
jgi:hypothetical protein